MSVPIKMLQLAGWLRKRSVDFAKRSGAVPCEITNRTVELHAVKDWPKMQEWFETIAYQRELEVILGEVDRLLENPGPLKLVLVEDERERDPVIASAPLEVADTIGALLGIGELEPSDALLERAGRMVNGIAGAFERMLSVVILNPQPGVQELIRRLHNRDENLIGLLVDMLAHELARQTREVDK